VKQGHVHEIINTDRTRPHIAKGSNPTEPGGLHSDPSRHAHLHPPSRKATVWTRASAGYAVSQELRDFHLRSPPRLKTSTGLRRTTWITIGGRGFFGANSSVKRNSHSSGLDLALEGFDPGFVHAPYLSQRIDLFAGRRQSIGSGESSGNRRICFRRQRGNREIRQETPFPKTI
jgi:hypothetical protein